MDRQPADEWIEIELTEHTPGRRARRGGRAGAAAPTLDRPAPPPLEPPPGVTAPPVGDEPGAPHDRRRTAAIAAGVGVAALLVGWLAGSAGDGDARSTPTTEAAADSTTRGTFADDAALETPSTIRVDNDSRAPLAPTTSGAPSVVTGRYDEPDPHFADSTDELVYIATGGDLSFLELANGETVSIDLNRGDRLLTGTGWALTWNDSNPQRATLTRNDDPDFGGTTVGLEDMWSTFTDPDGEHLWTLDPPYWLEGGAVAQIEPDGTPTGVTIDLPSYPYGVDPAGGFLIEVPSGHYSAGPEGAVRLTTGSLAAVGAGTFVANECDEALTCGYVVVDRATGERRPVEHVEPAGVNWGWGATPVSPDERWAVVMLVWQTADPNTESPQGPGLINLATGEVTRIPVSNRIRLQYVQRLQWSADSRFAFLLGDGYRVLAYDTVTHELFAVTPENTRVTDFDIRPFAGHPFGLQMDLDARMARDPGSEGDDPVRLRIVEG